MMLSVLGWRDISSRGCLSGVTGTRPPLICCGILCGTGGVGAFQLSPETTRGLFVEKNDFALVVVRPRKSDRAL